MSNNNEDGSPTRSPRRRSITPERRTSGSPGYKRRGSYSPKGRRERFSSRSPPRRRRSPYRKKFHQRDVSPQPSKVVGFFGLPKDLKEDYLVKMITEEFKIEKFHLVLDRESGMSKGFGFAYFEDIETATKCKEKFHKKDMNGWEIRTDYSITDKPNEPTPGKFLGYRPPREYDGGYRRGGGGGYRRGGYQRRGYSPQRRDNYSSHGRYERRYSPPPFQQQQRRYSPERKRYSPERKKESPERRKYSPERKQESPERRRYSPVYSKPPRKYSQSPPRKY